jgi:phage gpG-like protein
MAGISIDVDVNAPKALLASLQAVLRPELLLKLLGLRYTNFLSTRFEGDGSVPNEGIGAKWVPLKPSTVMQRRQGSSRPLQDTGRLKMSYTGTPNFGADWVEVGSNMEYASYHEEGTKPYVITPKTKKALAAKLSAGGWVVFGKRVNHPGIPARPVLPDVPLAERIGVEEIESVIDDVTGKDA